MYFFSLKKIISNEDRYDGKTSIRKSGFYSNERNCFFINLGNGKFADISGLSGLDFPDDGRAISVTDWDNDGDLDLWITNRNAPRLRLMRNDTKEVNSFISLRLSGNGKTVNKDAIGARIEIINGNDSGKFKQIKTLRAGQGFLSQSSKWIPFALNETDECKKNLSSKYNHS